MATVQALTTPTRRAREYETIYIMRSNVDSDGAEAVMGKVREVIESLEGKLLKVDNWGRRRLAYPVEKSARGVFVYVRFVGFEDLVSELERNLKLAEAVLRYQTILTNPRVSAADYSVADDDLVFHPLDDAPEDEEPGMAQRLGLVERPRRVEPEAPVDAAQLTPPAATPEGEGAAAPAAAEASEAKPAAAAAEAPEAKPDAAEAPEAKPEEATPASTDSGEESAS